MDIRTIWERRDRHPYPRGVLRLVPITDRRLGDAALHSWEEIEDFARFRKDVYVNVFSEDQRKSKVYDCIYLDIDHRDMRLAFLRLLRIIAGLEDGGVVHYHVVFSGSKGFNVYVPMDDVFLHDYAVAVKKWLAQLKVLKYIDTQVIEPNRVSRLVGTVNSKSNLTCVYVGDEEVMKTMTYEKTLDMAKAGKGNEVRFWSDNDMDVLKKYDQPVRTSESIGGKMEGKSVLWKSVKHYPPCMESLVVEAHAGTDLGHSERLEMGKFLLHIHGEDVDKVARIYSMMSDYSESMTKYHLNYILRRDLKISSCDKLIEQGICPYMAGEAEKECPYYPGLNKYIKIDRAKRINIVK